MFPVHPAHRALLSVSGRDPVPGKGVPVLWAAAHNDPRTLFTSLCYGP